MEFQALSEESVVGRFVKGHDFNRAENNARTTGL
jgi:hypothetical protein